jgi:hypothetical protein
VSMAWVASPWQGCVQTMTVRQFCRAMGMAAAAIALGSLIYLVEKYGLHLERRFIENPLDVVMRAFALAHFLVGWLFLFTSPRLRDGAAIRRLLLACLGGAGLCALFASCGGTRNPFLVMFFYGYFLAHEVRDEARLCQVYGDARPAPGGQLLLQPLAVAATAILMTALACGYFSYHALAEKHTSLDQVPPGALALAVGALGLFSVAAGYRYVQHGRHAYGGLRPLLAAHQPLLTVYGALLLILMVGSPLGSAGLNLIILVHVTAWLVFTVHQLSKRPPVPIKNLWGWLRSTPTGFAVLHVGVALAVLVLMAVRVHAWQRVGFVSELLASSNFCYWGLLHISIAFGSPRS